MLKITKHYWGIIFLLLFFLSLNFKSASAANYFSDPAPCDSTLPVILANGPLTFCAGGNVVLSDANGRYLNWSNGLRGSSVSITTTGHYTAYYNDGNGCVSSATAIDVIVKAKPVASFHYPYSICEGDSEIAYVTSQENIRCTWPDGSIGDSTWMGSVNNFYYGQQFNVIVTNDQGCSVTLTDNTDFIYTPDLTLTGNFQICPGGTTTISLLNPLSGVNYLWSNGTSGTSVQVSGYSDFSVGVSSYGPPCGPVRLPRRYGDPRSGYWCNSR